MITEGFPVEVVPFRECLVPGWCSPPLGDSGASSRLISSTPSRILYSVTLCTSLLQDFVSSSVKRDPSSGSLATLQGWGTEELLLESQRMQNVVNERRGPAWQARTGADQMLSWKAKAQERTGSPSPEGDELVGSFIHTTDLY